MKSNFIVRMFPAVNDPKNQFYLLLELDGDEIEIQAENMQYQVKLLEIQLKFKYSLASKK